MGLIDIDLTKTPDVTPEIAAGPKTFTVKAVEDKFSKGDPQANPPKPQKAMFVFQCQVTDDNDADNGRPMTIYLMKDDQRGQVGLRRLALSCGLKDRLEAKTLGLEDFIGRPFKGIVSHSVRPDQNGVVKTRANLQGDDILIPGDAGF